jgi:hypothetical protein
MYVLLTEEPMLAFTYKTANMAEYATVQNLIEYFCRSTHN